MIARRALPLLLLALLAAGCHHDDEGPIAVSVIGPAIDSDHPPSPDRGPLDAPAAVLATATAQGLIRYDASGQTVPGLAARWIVGDTGRSLIFRLPDPTGRPAITAETVARRLRLAIAPQSRNPLKPLLGAIAEVDAVTPQVIDVELRAPRPNLLELFAQPALTIGGPRGGAGPFEIVSHRDGLVTLRERPAGDIDPAETPARPAIVQLRGERAGTAVARFVAGRAALVLGGCFTDLPVARAATLPRGALRFDPARGLFGLAFTAAAPGPLADAGVRRALAMAIDRDRIARLIAMPGWTPATGIVPRGTPEIAEPALPDWSARPLADRQAEARGIVGASALPPLRVAMPAGPGARLLFAAIAANWRAIGVTALAVGPDDPADLRLIDEVAPGETAAFYLRSFACERGFACTTASDSVLIAARVTPSLPERSVLFTQADALIAATAPFIALGPPIRWSLVAPDLDLYRDTPRAIHPLNELRTPSMR
jgi:peptide/nickel transport system substrate-binding protein